MTKEERAEIFDLNFAVVRRKLNIVNDGILNKIPSERLDLIAREITTEILLLIVGRNND